MPAPRALRRPHQCHLPQREPVSQHPITTTHHHHTPLRSIVLMVVFFSSARARCPTPSSSIWLSGSSFFMHYIPRKHRTCFTQDMLIVVMVAFFSSARARYSAPSSPIWLPIPSCHMHRIQCPQPALQVGLSDGSVLLQCMRDAFCAIHADIVHCPVLSHAPRPSRAHRTCRPLPT